MTKATAEWADLSMQVHIDASPEKVWAGLTEQMSDWWPADFYAGGQDGERKIEIEAWPGGRMFETWNNGGGNLWGTVIFINPNHALQIHGSLFPNWGGPTACFQSWELKADGEGTSLTFSESSVGRVSDEGMREKDKGWQFLWQTLKAHVEGKAPPAWED